MQCIVCVKFFDYHCRSGDDGFGLDNEVVLCFVRVVLLLNGVDL